MNAFLLDAFDIARFRVKPLAHYAYEWWLPPLVLTLLGLLPAFDTGLNAGLVERIVFFQFLSWSQTLLMVLFYGWWLKLGKRWNGEGSLFPLLVLANTVMVLDLLVKQVQDDNAAVLLTFVLALYQVSVTVVALARATGVKTGHVVAGIFAFMPTALILWLLAFNVASRMGWMPEAPDPAGPTVITAPQEQA